MCLSFLFCFVWVRGCLPCAGFVYFLSVVLCGFVAFIGLGLWVTFVVWHSVVSGSLYFVVGFVVFYVVIFGFVFVGVSYDCMGFVCVVWWLTVVFAFMMF